MASYDVKRSFGSKYKATAIREIVVIFVEAPSSIRQYADALIPICFANLVLLNFKRSRSASIFMEFNFMDPMIYSRCVNCKRNLYDLFMALHYLQ